MGGWHLKGRSPSPLNCEVWAPISFGPPAERTGGFGKQLGNIERPQLGAKSTLAKRPQLGRFLPVRLQVQEWAKLPLGRTNSPVGWRPTYAVYRQGCGRRIVPRPAARRTRTRGQLQRAKDSRYLLQYPPLPPGRLWIIWEALGCLPDARIGEISDLRPVEHRSGQRPTTCSPSETP